MHGGLGVLRRSTLLGRAISALGHDVKLIPARYVKPFVRRQKNDANDAAAIVEAASRASMRFVQVKSMETQAHAVLYRSRALFVKQRTQTLNAIRSHLGEFGLVCQQGVSPLRETYEALMAGTLIPPEPIPTLALETVAMLFQQVDDLTVQIETYEQKMHEITKTDAAARRFQTAPGIGPITAFALLAFVGDLSQFRNGREFAAWIGLMPCQHSTGGREQLGGITKMGQKGLRSLLVQGAMALYRQRRKNFKELSPRLQHMITTKKPKVIGVAWANKNARVLWALAVKGEDYKWGHQPHEV